MRNRKLEAITELELCYLAGIKFLRGAHCEYPLGILRIFYCVQKISRLLVDDFPLADSVFIVLSLLLIQKIIEKDQLVEKQEKATTFGIMQYKLQVK